MKCENELQRRDRDQRSDRRYVASGAYLNGGVFGKINLILEYSCRVPLDSFQRASGHTVLDHLVESIGDCCSRDIRHCRCSGMSSR